MSQEEKKETVFCCVMNCKKEIPIKNAITIGGKYFCKNCGVAYYRTTLNL
jgi:hypothetical protein